MELGNLLYILALLACPIGMGAMMWMMGRNMGGHNNHMVSNEQKLAQPATAERLANLRTQRQALEAEIAEVQQVAELEAQREALLKEKISTVNEPLISQNVS